MQQGEISSTGHTNPQRNQEEKQESTAQPSSPAHFEDPGIVDEGLHRYHCR
jgi:hypothetical protein